jgi:hypothetical protein
MEGVVKVQTTATNWDHGALLKVCAKAGDLAKALKDLSQVLNVIFDWGNKNCRVIRIKRGSKD